MIDELSLYPIDALVGDKHYRHFHLIVAGGRAKLNTTGRITLLDEELVTADRTGQRQWEVTTPSGTWTVTDSHGCGCSGSQIVPIA